MGCVVQVTEAGDVAAVRELFSEYARAVEEPRCFAGFEHELASLPLGYAALWLASCGDTAAGCAGLRPLDAATAEMKRLYVRPAHRGRGLGRALAQAVIGAARAGGYARLVLDTLPKMREAAALYRALGFEEIPPYLAQPTPGARCFGLRL